MKHISPRTVILSAMLAVFAWLLCGCMSVPKTSIKFNPQTKQLDIQSPKDVCLTNLSAEMAGDVVKITIGSYSSRNDAAIIKIVADQNIKAVQNAADMGKAAIDAAKMAGGL